MHTQTYIQATGTRCIVAICYHNCRIFNIKYYFSFFFHRLLLLLLLSCCCCNHFSIFAGSQKKQKQKKIKNTIFRRTISFQNNLNFNSEILIFFVGTSSFLRMVFFRSFFTRLSEIVFKWRSNISKMNLNGLIETSFIFDNI